MQRFGVTDATPGRDRRNAQAEEMQRSRHSGRPPPPCSDSNKNKWLARKRKRCNGLENGGWRSSAKPCFLRRFSSVAGILPVIRAEEMQRLADHPPCPVLLPVGDVQLSGPSGFRFETRRYACSCRVGGRRSQCELARSVVALSDGTAFRTQRREIATVVGARCGFDGSSTTPTSATLSFASGYTACTRFSESMKKRRNFLSSE